MRALEPGDLETLAANMRQADRDEIAAAGIPDPLAALQSSAACSTECLTALFDGEVACVFGVGPISILLGIGAPWMLGSDQITRHPGAFITHARPYILRMLQAYPHLFNFVDARNSKAIRWLKRVGFTLHDPVPHGPLGMPFHPFEMKA